MNGTGTAHEVPVNTLQRLRNAIGIDILDVLPGIEELDFDLDPFPGYYPVTFRIGLFKKESEFKKYQPWAYLKHSRSSGGQFLAPTVWVFLWNPKINKFLTEGAGVKLEDEFDDISFDVELKPCTSSQQVEAIIKYFFLLDAEKNVDERPAHNIPYTKSFEKDLIDICKIFREEAEHDTTSQTSDSQSEDDTVSLSERSGSVDRTAPEGEDDVVYAQSQSGPRPHESPSASISDVSDHSQAVDQAALEGEGDAVNAQWQSSPRPRESPSAGTPHRYNSPVTPPLNASSQQLSPTIARSESPTTLDPSNQSSTMGSKSTMQPEEHQSKEDPMDIDDIDDSEESEDDTPDSIPDKAPDNISEHKRIKENTASVLQYQRTSLRQIKKDLREVQVQLKRLKKDNAEEKEITWLEGSIRRLQEREKTVTGAIEKFEEQERKNNGMLKWMGA